ncbi:hypothetical protein OOU_Y34scaffold00605g5 [Pyricularia oryzae Y34]|uniref:Uncharacterized protein n=1 Tax=Pyricularia oryzae (strain Y34) TaxID=1143189 RepID=A0AA97NVZ6_PYRO3|nr:hypothetical protein OOU_Y34scaffold00605g5 [Pyricularia oryzae Y34]
MQQYGREKTGGLGNTNPVPFLGQGQVFGI